jgi:hypothetical protein
LTPTAFTALCAKGTDKFSGLATNQLPKLYIISISGKPVYVGHTKRSVRARLYEGWNATGKHGYHGYRVRHGNAKAVLSIWCHMDAVGRNARDIETVEAEVVYLIRSQGQWPEFQTEIHFHPSKQVHRKVAEGIMRHYQR